jgi:hypothetical protein
MADAHCAARQSICYIARDGKAIHKPQLQLQLQQLSCLLLPLPLLLLCGIWVYTASTHSLLMAYHAPQLAPQPLLHLSPPSMPR